LFGAGLFGCGALVGGGAAVVGVGVGVAVLVVLETVVVAAVDLGVNDDISPDGGVVAGRCSSVSLVPRMRNSTAPTAKMSTTAASEPTKIQGPDRPFSAGCGSDGISGGGPPGGCSAEPAGGQEGGGPKWVGSELPGVCSIRPDAPGGCCP
jgi:hypothetical protein